MKLLILSLTTIIMSGLAIADTANVTQSKCPITVTGATLSDSAIKGLLKKGYITTHNSNITLEIEDNLVSTNTRTNVSEAPNGPDYMTTENHSLTLVGTSDGQKLFVAQGGYSNRFYKFLPRWDDFYEDNGDSGQKQLFKQIPTADKLRENFGLCR